MKFGAIILAIFILLVFVSKKESSVLVSNPAPEVSHSEEISEEEEIPKEKMPALTEIKYSAPESKTPEIAVINYFSSLYNSYIAMLPMDISPVIDKDFEMMVNVLNWNNLLAMRRSIIDEKGYCYVEKERFPYIINFISEKELDDQRMDYVDLSDFGSGAVAVHFVIKGIEDKAYPPFFAANSQHSMVLTFEDGIYKIAYHYFPGSEGKFQNDLPVTMMEREEMEKILEKEFAKGEDLLVPEAIYEKTYDGKAAVEYAFEFCEEHNPDFHFVGDWYGNCMNFASQCVWSGFRTEEDTPKNYGSMTRDWYCGKNSGTLMWASVSRFYAWIEENNCDMQTITFTDMNEVLNGDIVHIGSYLCEEEEKYTHALIVADSEKMLLAQNSPACFVYYSDLVNNYARFIRPISLDA